MTGTEWTPQRVARVVSRATLAQAERAKDAAYREWRKTLSGTWNQLHIHERHTRYLRAAAAYWRLRGLM